MQQLRPGMQCVQVASQPVPHMASLASLTPDLVWAVLSKLCAEERRAVSPVCPLWDELVRLHQTRFVLSFDYEDSALWEDTAAVAALGSALGRRPGLRELHAASLDCVRALIRQTGMLGDFEADCCLLEPAAGEVLGFVGGRMPALDTLRLTSSFRGDFVVRLPHWAGCLGQQLRSLEMQPVKEFPLAVCRLTQLTCLSLHHPGTFKLPTEATALRQLHKLRLSYCTFPRALRLQVLPALRSIQIFYASLPDLEWVQGLTGLTCISLLRCQKSDGTHGESDFPQSECSAALHHLTQLHHACLSSCAQPALAGLDLPRMPGLTTLCLFDPGILSYGHPSKLWWSTVSEDKLRCTLALLPSLRHLYLCEAVDEDGKHRVCTDFPQFSLSLPDNMEWGFA